MTAMHLHQSKVESAVESFVNVAIGLTVSMTCNLVAIPLIFNVTITAKQNIAMAVFYTVVSVVRSYCIRRYFNRAIGKFDKLLANNIRRLLND